LDLEQIQAERLDLGQHAVQCRPVQQAGEHGVGAVMLPRQRREGRQHGGAEVPVDPGAGSMTLMITGGQVTPGQRDRVTPRGVRV
jgi:hypothetical protein